MSFLTFVFLCVLRFVPPPVFRELPVPGFPTERRLMYGGPAIADLNRDGYPDLLLCYHNSASIDIFYNDGTPAFTKQTFNLNRDNHAIVPAPGNSSAEMLFAVSVGGSFGDKPNSPQLFSVTSNGISDITSQRGIDERGGRGRNALFLDLGGSPDLDVIFTNALPNDPDELPQFGYQNVPPKYQLHALPGFEKEPNENLIVTDIDGDGVVEIITFPTLKIFRRVSDFKFEDISDQVLPEDVNRRGVVAVAEIDYDNDGDFDLFVARTNTSSLYWVKEPHFDDYLLENRNGKYVDASESAKIPKGLGTRGVTVADFNNDGYVDVFVSRYSKSDLLLLNKRDKSFHAIPHSITRPPTVHGDNAQAADLNADGYIDLVVSHGDQHDIEYGGYYKVYLNTTPKSRIAGFVEVCVGRSPRGRSAMHALVKANIVGLTMVRRVGEVGVAVSRSYLECVHFGLAIASTADVEVRWVGGEVARKSVECGETARIGSF